MFIYLNLPLNPIDYNARLKVFLFVLVLDFASVVVEIAKQIQ